MLENPKKKNLTITVIIAFLVMFYAAWTLKALVVEPLIASAELGIWAEKIVNACIKLAVWIVPSVLLIKKYGDDMEISLGEMFSGKFSWKPYILIFVAFTLYILFGAWRNFGKIAIHEDFHLSTLIGGFIVVGITEELVFRGFLLNAFLKKMPEYAAIALNAVLFLAIHFPIWIASGKFVSNFTSGAFISIMVLSAVFSLTFIKSKRIWVPVALHMFWDLLVFLLYS